MVSQGNSPCARWSIFASPARTLCCGAGDADPLARFAEALASTARTTPNSGELPFIGGWIGWLSYDLGRVIEPAAQAPAGAGRAQPDRDWPLLETHYCPAAYVHDAKTDEWSIVGDPAHSPALDPASACAEYRVGRFYDGDRAEYLRAVNTTVDRIGEGDLFQANIARRLSAEFTGSMRGAAHDLLSGAGAWYGAYIESIGDVGRPSHAICSVSPELFLSFDPRSRRVETRPIKGTRRDMPGAERDLTASAKDAAELTMIVDLMRNDLGRVCEFGSVRVDEPRRIERHAQGKTGALLHGVATVSGVLRPNQGISELLRATFPPGSVTGAPKVQAMRVIDQHEAARRGPYCGCVGFVSDCGRSEWNVAIRTAAMKRNLETEIGILDYWTGAGIVAESDPALEWEETVHKTSVLRRAFPGSFGGAHGSSA